MYQLKLPDLGEGLTEATIVSWLVGVADAVTKNQVLAEVETAKATVEIPSPRGGIVLHLAGKAGDTVAVGSLLAVIGDPGEVWSGSTQVSAVAGPIGIVSGPDIAPAAPRGFKATLAVRKLATELCVDLAHVTGSGAGGNVVEADVRAAMDAGNSRPLTPFRRTIARNLTAAWAAPQVSAWASTPAKGLLAAARAQQQPIEALVLRAILPVLDEYPEFSAHFDGQQLSGLGRHDIGFAVDSPKGLVVAVLRNAGSLTRAEIGDRTQRLLTLGREGKLPPGELGNQTFTLSNIGALGGRYGTSIVPLNTTAMLSIGRAADEVLAINGTIAIQMMLPLGLSFDHRVIDGAAGQRFLASACEAIEHIENGDPQPSQRSAVT